MKRISSIDFVRGLVMIIMPLDHVRDLLHIDSLAQSPTNMATTTPILFFTRWITHLCAPTFVFLAGTSAGMSLKRSGNLGESRRFLLKRGLWLIVVEFSFVNFGIFFDPGFHNLIWEVIAAIGFGFIILSLLLGTSVRTITIIGLAILLCQGLFPMIPFGEGSVIKTIVSPFFLPGGFPLSPKTIFMIGYPPLPWLGVMLLGFASGKFFEYPDEKRRGIFWKIGLGSLLFFVLVRLINIYGDPVPWSAQKNALYTFLSFMNVSKYPPSLLFCSATLGIMFFFLAYGERVRNRFTAFASVYGKAPLFYFLVHFYLIHILLLAILFLQGFHWQDLSFARSYGRPTGVASGVSLGVVYLIWIGVVLAMYFPCRWFGEYKAAHKDWWWLRYM